MKRLEEHTQQNWQGPDCDDYAVFLCWTMDVGSDLDVAAEQDAPSKIGPAMK